MIEFIEGVISEKNPTHVILENNGLGYFCNISIQTFKRLAEKDEKVRLFTYLHVREDAMQLYAFADKTERDVFISLISVSGIGPKLAQTILSGVEVKELVSSIHNENINRLTSISGIGKKTAQRMIVELKEKLQNLGIIADETDIGMEKVSFNSMEEEAIMALMSLGYKRQGAERALLKIRKSDEKILSVEALIKKILQTV